LLQKKTYIYILVLFLISTHLNAQRIYKVFLGSDMYQPLLTEKKMTRYGINYAHFPNERQSTISLKASSALTNAIAVKVNFRKAVRTIFGSSISRATLNTTGINFGVGYFRSYATKKAVYKYEWYKENSSKYFDPYRESKLEWRNTYRRSKRKKRIKQGHRFIRPASWLFDAYLSYGIANSKMFNYDCFELGMERFNLDLGINYFCFGRFSYSNSFRFSFVNLKKINETFCSEGVSYLISKLENVEPFIAAEYNLKINYELNNINIYAKINNVLGKSFENQFAYDNDYSPIAYNWSLVYGIDFIIKDKKRKRA